MATSTWPAPEIEAELPRQARLRRERAESICAGSRAGTGELGLAGECSGKVGPKAVRSDTEAERPAQVRLRMDVKKPRAVESLAEIAAPKATCDEIDAALPKQLMDLRDVKGSVCARPGMGTTESRWPGDRIDRAEPGSIPSSTGKVGPKQTAPKVESLEPKVQRLRVNIEEPSALAPPHEMGKPDRMKDFISREDPKCTLSSTRTGEPRRAGLRGGLRTTQAFDSFQNPFHTCFGCKRMVISCHFPVQSLKQLLYKLNNVKHVIATYLAPRDMSSSEHKRSKAGVGVPAQHMPKAETARSEYAELLDDVVGPTWPRSGTET